MMIREGREEERRGVWVSVETEFSRLGDDKRFSGADDQRVSNRKQNESNVYY